MSLITKESSILVSWHCIVQFMFLKWNGLLCAQTPSFTFSVWESISAVDCGCCELRQSLPHSTRAPVCFGMHCPRCAAHCVEHAQTLHNTLVSHFSQALFVTHWTSCIFSCSAHCLVSHLNRKCKSTWSLCGHWELHLFLVLAKKEWKYWWWWWWGRIVLV